MVVFVLKIKLANLLIRRMDVLLIQRHLLLLLVDVLDFDLEANEKTDELVQSINPDKYE